MTRVRLPLLIALVLASITAATVGLLLSVSAAGPADAAAPAGSYVALPPTRLLDTRAGFGGAAPGPAQTVHLQVLGAGGIPGSGVAAVVLTLTVTGPSEFGYLTAYPDGGNPPTASNLNFVAGQTVANLAVVAVGGNGKVGLVNGSAGTTQVIADVSGYYTAGTPNAAGAFVSLPPNRLLDTRSDPGRSAVPAFATLQLAVANNGGVPSGVTAVVLNVTVTAPVGAGFLTTFADPGNPPTASNLNFVSGQTVPNVVLAPVGVDGVVDFYNGSPGAVHLVADVAGYFLPGMASSDGALQSLAPTRLLDTRSALGGTTPGAWGTVELQVTGRGGVPASGVAAVVLNVTAATPSRLGFLTAYADHAIQPSASNLNFAAGKTVPNLVIAPVSANGNVALFNGSAGSTPMVADVFGYVLGTPTNPTFTPPTASVSRYVRDLTGASSDVTLMSADGCADASANGTSGSFLMVLDIGAQTITAPLSAANPGVVLTTTTTRLPYAALVTAVDAYVDGYASCQGGSSTAMISIATNSDGDFSVYSAASKGDDWDSSVVAPVQAHAAGHPAISIVGGVDTEAGFAATEVEAEQWISAFTAAGNATLVQIGSADGCPTTPGVTGQSCAPVTDANGVTKVWTQENYYALAHGLSPRIVLLPQIYFADQAQQWAGIDRTGASVADKINIVGALTEQAACGSACSMAPAQAFATLYEALSGSSLTSPATMIYSTDLRIDG